MFLKNPLLVSGYACGLVSLGMGYNYTLKKTDNILEKDLLSHRDTLSEKEHKRSKEMISFTNKEEKEMLLFKNKEEKEMLLLRDSIKEREYNRKSWLRRFI